MAIVRLKILFILKSYLNSGIDLRFNVLFTKTIWTIYTNAIIFSLPRAKNIIDFQENRRVMFSCTCGRFKIITYTKESFVITPDLCGEAIRRCAGVCIPFKIFSIKI